MAEVRVAALYDVHGNAPALEAVLADLGDVDLVLFGGDLVWGPWPRETLELARSIDGARFISGNMDRIALAERDDMSMRWVQERLSDEEAQFVRDWPATASIGGALYCHATPRNDTEVVTPDSEEGEWAEVLDGVDERLVVCGHTHLQYDIDRAGRRVVNPGSIGLPTIRASAWWAVVGDTVELRTTDYDVPDTARAMRASGFPRPDFPEQLERPPEHEELRERWRA